MRDDAEILELIRRGPEVTALLWDVCEFDLERAGYYSPVRLSSGLPLEGVAGDYTGGAFFLCGEPSPSRPVLYASSEGEAGVIGRDLAAALAVTIGLPS
ncbi:hypothetical protein ACFFX1_42640 [Dactylosporangium sucinum]|uniref:Uncharacterized protein n=1 Tax=Dactylosporangium sucinum TaxID=1424081 RepID=A0A917U9S3_9ACTN|nr:hypothetical protein [Dactylosporangium sucinum]GGM63018.1 hypothetical protein GCM10007977_075760 [Dactylosporangium sucinum]